MKTVMTLAATVTMALSLAACGGGTTTDNSATEALNTNDELVLNDTFGNDATAVDTIRNDLGGNDLSANVIETDTVGGNAL